MRGGVEEGDQPPATAPSLLEGAVPHKSPPLSAAPSQVSLSGSTSSDTDLSTSERGKTGGSNASYSRPSSSSSGVVSPDITATVEEDVNELLAADVVECTTAPQGSSDTLHSLQQPNTTSSRPLLTLPPSGAAVLVEADSGAHNSDVEEEYFEEFHLPNTHEKTFVRHRSFRRRVEHTDINAPDAEKIEGLVRTGELERHGSVRRKIVATVTAAMPEEDEYDEGREQPSLYRLEEDEMVIAPDGDYIGDHGPKSLNVQEFSEDFHQIRRMMDDPDHHEELNHLKDEDSKDGLTPRLLLLRGQNAYTSTPNTAYASTADYNSIIDLSASLTDRSKKESSSESCNGTELESMSIEQSTLNKVKECMDFNNYKDIYSLTGKLQDMLTPIEVEEVLNNSHRYVDYIDSGILEALFNSVSEQMSITGQPMSITFTKPTTKEIKQDEQLTKEEEELQYKIKQKLLMEELALDSLPFIDINASSRKEGEEENEVAGSDDVVFRRKDSSEDGQSSRYGTIERRKSLRVSNGQSQVELEGVFVESDFKDSKMKTISAPIIDLMNNLSQDDIDMDESRTGLEESMCALHYDELKEKEPSRLAVQDPLGVNSSLSSIPCIKITKTESSEDNISSDNLENSSVNNLYVMDGSSSLGVTEGSTDYTTEEEPKMYSSCRPKAAASSDDDFTIIDDDDILGALEHDSSGASMPMPPPFMSMPPEGGSENEERHWRTVVIGGVWRRIDMKVIEPYRKCVSAGGQHSGHSVVVVSACQLPERSRSDYSYVMDNLFLYILSRLEQLVSEDYILVYLSGGRNISNTGPGFHWLKAAYQMIDRKLRKNLQALLVVHPTLWVRTIVALTRPFISGKFYRKLTFVYSLTELAQLIPLHQLDIPDSVKEADFELMIREKKRNVPRKSKPSPFR